MEKDKRCKVHRQDNYILLLDQAITNQYVHFAYKFVKWTSNNTLHKIKGTSTTKL